MPPHQSGTCIVLSIRKARSESPEERDKLDRCRQVDRDPSLYPQHNLRRPPTSLMSVPVMSGGDDLAAARSLRRAPCGLPQSWQRFRQPGREVVHGGGSVRYRGRHEGLVRLRERSIRALPSLQEAHLSGFAPGERPCVGTPIVSAADTNGARRLSRSQR